jgi:probable F420-dependent oxidoreductase
MSDSEDPRSARYRLGTTGVWLGSLAVVSARAGADAAAEIEQLGYGALWIGEAPTGKEAYTHSALLLAATSRIVVATGIANIWARDAWTTLAAAEGLGEAYPGRFLLGLGVSHAPLVQVRGHDYTKPLSAMRSYLDGLEQSRESYAGVPADPPVPVVLAALRSKMIKLARDRTAGAHPYLVIPEHTARTRQILGEGPLLAPEQAVLLQRDPVRARETAREYVKHYLELPNYTRNLLELGFDETDLSNGGSDRLVDALVAWGDAEQIAARVRAHHDAGADHVAIQPLGSTLDDQLQQLRELAPVLLS